VKCVIDFIAKVVLLSMVIHDALSADLADRDLVLIKVNG
jgi:hypothetical protein